MNKDANQPFLQSFYQAIQKIYVHYAPGFVRSTWTKIDGEGSITFRFGIAHPRGVDEISIRFVGSDLIVDFMPGKTVTPLCLFYGLKPQWITLDFSKSALALSNKEKQQVEKTVIGIHALSISHFAELKILLSQPVFTEEKC